MPGTRCAITLHAMVMALCLMIAAPQLARADGFETVNDKASFLTFVQDRVLRLALFDITIAVKSDGTITGQALGWDLTGNWVWDEGLFCREMDWSGAIISRNCQLVEVADGQSIRFTVDGGRGRAATFQIN